MEVDVKARRRPERERERERMCVCVCLGQYVDERVVRGADRLHEVVDLKRRRDE